MSELGPQSFSEPWYSSGVEGIDLTKIKDDATRRALEQLKRVAQEQSRILQEWRQMLQYGPVPGGYLPIHFTRFQSGGVAVANGISSANLPVPLYPIAVSASAGGLSGGNTMSFRLVEVDAGGTNTTIFGPQAVDQDGQSWRARGDFAVSRHVTNRVRMDVTANAAAGERIHVVLWCKNASRIEP